MQKFSLFSPGLICRIASTLLSRIFLKPFNTEQVENTLYKLYDDILTALFKDMFTIGDGSCSTEGKSDAEPIFLEGEQQAIFDLFLDHINDR